MTLSRQGHHDLVLCSTIRGWTEEEAVQKSRELERDIARRGIELVCSSEEEGLVVSQAEAEGRAERDQLRAFVRRAIVDSASHQDPRADGPGLVCQVWLRYGQPVEGILSETPDGLLIVRRVSEGRRTTQCHVFTYDEVSSVVLSVPLKESL